MNDGIALADRLNRECACAGTDLPALREQLDLLESHTHLFADVPVFVAMEHAREMQRVISAVEAITRLPAFREQVLSTAPEIARHSPRTRGAFLGFDFHIAAEGPKLIEINTNAGGALLNIEMLRAQQACCTQVADFLRLEPSADSRARAIVDMFMSEWRLARGDAPLRVIAIVDDSPREQYLFPEFLLFKALFETQGIRAIVVHAILPWKSFDQPRTLPIDRRYRCHRETCGSEGASRGMPGL